MKALKYLAQILSAIAYTCLYVILLYFIFMYPFVWFISLSWKWMVLIFIFLGGIIASVASLVWSFFTAPYMWITKKNVVAFALSSIILFLSISTIIIRLWRVCYGGNGLAMFICVFITGYLIYILYITITFMYFSYQSIVND